MTDHEIPPLLPPDQMPPVVDQASLEHTWRALMGELGFAGPQLWMLFLRDGRCVNIGKIEDVPTDPSPEETQAVFHLLAHLSEDPTFCAFLYARPGRRGLTAGDLAWARGLSRPVHVANDFELRVVAPDDLARAG
jgi:hypothetical protein